MKNFNDCTQAQRVKRWENVLRVLRALTPHQRRKHWDMTHFGEKTDCGTVACAAGHCGFDPWFRRQGWKSAFRNAGFCEPPEVILEGIGWMGLAIDDFFGESGAEAIFMNDRPRSVGTVIREVRAHIKALRAQS